MNSDPRSKPDAHHAAGGKDKPNRLDTIEQADNRTRRLDPERASASTDPVEDMLQAGESNADYKDEARRVAPTLGPPEDGASEA